MSLLATMNATWQQLIYVPPTRRSRGPCRSVGVDLHAKDPAQMLWPRLHPKRKLLIFVRAGRINT